MDYLMSEKGAGLWRVRVQTPCDCCSDEVTFSTVFSGEKGSEGLIEHSGTFFLGNILI